MILACSKIAINCNFTARIISLLYIYPQFTVHILHVMYLHIWRGQTTCTFHGLYNWKSSHRLQLWKRVYMVQCNLLPNTLYIGKPNDKWKTVLVPQSSWLPSQHARPTPRPVPIVPRKMLESCSLECQKVAKKLPKIQKVAIKISKVAA